MSNKINGLIKFDLFRLDTETNELWHENEPIVIAPKTFELLNVLTSQPGEIIKKEALIMDIWPDSDKGENNLSHAVHTLRKAFQQYSDTEYIVTVPRRGYRFVGEVETISKETSIQQAEMRDLDAIEDHGNTGIVRSATTDIGKRAKYLALGFAAVLILTFAAFIIWNFRQSQTISPIGQVNSIAVIPMKVFDGLDENLGIRIADSVITRINNLDNVSVRPTSSIIRYSNDESDVLEIGKKLNVDVVIDGRVQQQGSAIRITMQAISSRSGDILWSDQFTGQPDKLLALQDSIVERLGFHLSTRLGRDTTMSFGKRPTENAEAYENYLKARFFWQKRTYESLKNAVRLFERATELDPNFAHAYVGLADSLYLLYDYNYESDLGLVERAKIHLDKAISIDPGLSDAHTTLGLIRSSYDFQWEHAESSYKTALSLDPASSDALHRYATHVVRFRRFDEAESMLRRALEFNPTSPGINLNLGMVFYFSGRHDQAMEQFKLVLDQDSSFVSPYWYMARCQWQKGDKKEALKTYASALRLSGSGQIAEMIESELPKESFEDILRRWIIIWEKNNVGSHSIAILASHLNDKKNALRLINKALESKHPWITMTGVEPEFEFLRDEPDFQAILTKIGLQQLNP